MYKPAVAVQRLLVLRRFQSDMAIGGDDFGRLPGHASPLLSTRIMEIEMPKMKTRSSTKGRFKLTASGKVKGRNAFRSHMMENKSQKMKRQSRGAKILSDGDARLVTRNMMPYGKKFS